MTVWQRDSSEQTFDPVVDVEYKVRSRSVLSACPRPRGSRHAMYKALLTAGLNRFGHVDRVNLKLDR